MTEVKIGTGTAILDVAAEYLGDAEVVGQVARYKPFLSWAGGMNIPSHITVKTIDILTADLMVGRLCCVRLSLLLEAKSGATTRQAVTLRDDEEAAVLIVVSIEETDFVLITKTPTPCTGEARHLEIPFGTIKSTGFKSECSGLLKQAEVSLTSEDMLKLTGGAGCPPSLCPDEPGTHPVKFYLSKMAKPRTYRDAFPLTDGPISLDLVPLESLESASSARTLVALELFNTYQASTRN
eukprot:TRINITY_DN17987_c0_g1_i1.p1 TRINITY_DN17987_c0_g1~~TRINITY_DN17987_c0_g1_i1.p1  ORF type:complete len:238 (+),score=36.28 TRINITY_DN17987_c0_g1_i1:45-758(+)